MSAGEPILPGHGAQTAGRLQAKRFLFELDGSHRLFSTQA